MQVKKSAAAAPLKEPPSLVSSTPFRGGSSGGVGAGVRSYSAVVQRLAKQHGAKRTKAELEEDDDDDDEDDDDFDPDADSGSDDDDAAADDDDEDEDDDYSDSDDDDEDMGEQAEEATAEDIEAEDARAEQLARKEATFKRKSHREHAGEHDEHVLVDDDGNDIEDEDEDDEEDVQCAEDLGPEMRTVIAGAWRMLVAKYGVLKLREEIRGAGTGVLSADERKRIGVAMSCFVDLQAALRDLRAALMERLASETAPNMKRMSKLILESLEHKSLIVLPAADMVGVSPGEAGGRCSVTGEEIVRNNGYFLEFKGAKNAAGAITILRLMVTKKAATAIGAVNYLVRMLDAMDYHAAKLAESAALAAGSAWGVDSGKFVKTHCLIDAKGVVDYYYNMFSRQLVFVKGIVYKDLKLPPLLQTAYETVLAENKKKKN